MTRDPEETPARPAGVSVSGAPAPAPPPVARRLAEAGIVLTSVIWSFNFVIVKASIMGVGALAFTGVRYTVACLVLFALLRHRNGSIRVPQGTALPLLGLGVLGFGLYQLCWTFGLTQITAGDSSLIVAASPVLTAVIAGVVGIDRLTAPKLAGALVAFAGVAIVIGAGEEITLGSSLLGDGLTLLAAVIWSVYPVLGTRLLARVDPLQTTAWTVLGGALVLVPLGAWDLLTRGPVGWTAASMVAVVYSGSMAAGVANVLVWNAIRYIGPTRATVTQFLVPPGAVLLGVIFLAEPLGWPQVVGGGVIVLGLWLARLSSLSPRRPRRPSRSSGPSARTPRRGSSPA